MVQVRAPDGVHFTTAGYDMVMEVFYPAITQSLKQRGHDVAAECEQTGAREGPAEVQASAARLGVGLLIGAAGATLTAKSTSDAPARGPRATVPGSGEPASVARAPAPSALAVAYSRRICARAIFRDSWNAR